MILKRMMTLFVLLCITSHADTIRADVTAVTTQGKSGEYRFSVTLSSTETGCAQYADWWEVLNEKGKLIYRRILVHSHPDTQPFTRSGGKVNIKPNTIVYVRAHMNKLGYVGDVYKGSVQEGFYKSIRLPIFSEDLEKQQPLPKGCAY